MFVHTQGGDTYTFAQVEEWTSAAGFSEGRALPLTPHTHVWLADKP